jgi:hypothetical protein
MEYRRAIAAERRYEDLRYRRVRRRGSESADLPRSVFIRFYSRADDVDVAAP